MLQMKFHIWFGDRRTTITVDTVLFELMAIRLKYDPADPEAYGAVREWLQEKLVAEFGEGRGRSNASQWARRYLIEAIADRRLLGKWNIL